MKYNYETQICLQKLWNKLNKNGKSIVIKRKSKVDKGGMQWMRPCWKVGGRFLLAPREARLQFALLPSITGDGFWHALMADSGSLNVTLENNTSQTHCSRSCKYNHKWNNDKQANIINYAKMWVIRNTKWWRRKMDLQSHNPWISRYSYLW